MTSWKNTAPHKEHCKDICLPIETAPNRLWTSCSLSAAPSFGTLPSVYAHKLVSLCWKANRCWIHFMLFCAHIWTTEKWDSYIEHKSHLAELAITACLSHNTARAHHLSFLEVKFNHVAKVFQCKKKKGKTRNLLCCCALTSLDTHTWNNKLHFHSFIMHMLIRRYFKPEVSDQTPACEKNPQNITSRALLKSSYGVLEVFEQSSVSSGLWSLPRSQCATMRPWFGVMGV